MRFRRKIIKGGFVVVIILVFISLWSSKEVLYSNQRNVNNGRFIHNGRNNFMSMRAKSSVIYFQQQATNVSLSRIEMDNKIDWIANSPRIVPNKEPEDHLTIIVVPHSHTDPGWLYTPEDYYEIKTRQILSLAVNKLSKYENMTFIWSETVFLHMWWSEQNSSTKAIFRRLLKSGRLEIVSGGWVMADESVTHYYSLLNEMFDGHDWLKQELNYHPAVVWSIDPFGHSSTLPYMWSKAGLNHMAIQRVSKRYKEFLSMKKTLEFKWRQVWDPTGSDDVTCHIPPYPLYSIKDSCGPSMSVCMFLDFKNMAFTPDQLNDNDYIIKVSKMLLNQLRKKSSNYRHNVVLLPIGDDFRYDVAEEWDNQYPNLMKIMTFINNTQGLKASIRYGTLRDYFYELDKSINRSKVTLPVYSGDFLPYSDNYYDFWTGFYSSCPAQKRAARQLQEIVYTARMFDFFGNFNFFNYNRSLEFASRTLSLLQHHDTITGTSKWHVVNKFKDRIQKAAEQADDMLKSSIQRALALNMVHNFGETRESEDIYKSLQGSLKTELQILNDNIRYIIITNSLEIPRNEMVTLQVDTFNLRITNENKGPVKYQINPIRDRIRIISESDFELLFEVAVPPLGYVVYTVEAVDADSPNATYKEKVSITMINGNLSLVPLNVFHVNLETVPSKIENEFLLVRFDSVSGSLENIFFKPTKQTLGIKTDILAYTSSERGGKYVFYPEGKAVSVTSSKADIFVVSGDLSERVEISYPAVRVAITVFKFRRHQARNIDIKCYVDMQKYHNKELILRLYTDINNQGLFFTDSNGYQFVRRQTFSTKDVNGNYYPITSAVIIEDERRRLTLHTSQPHGVASLQNGWLEVMLDRLPSSDDKRGAGEGLSNSVPYEAKFTLELEPCHRKPEWVPSILVPSFLGTTSMDIQQHPLFVIGSSSYQKIIGRAARNQYIERLPPGTHIAFLKHTVIDDTETHNLKVIFHQRVQACCGCIASSSKPVELDLWGLFRHVTVTYIRETTLTFLKQKRKILMGNSVKLMPMSFTAFEMAYGEK